MPRAVLALGGSEAVKNLPRIRTKKGSLETDVLAGCSWDMRGANTRISLTPTLGCPVQKLYAGPLSVVLDREWPGCAAIWAVGCEHGALG